MAGTIAPGTTRYLCPLRCGWHHDVPPPSATDAAGIPFPPDVTDLGGAISHLAAEATLRAAANAEAAIVAHLGTHTMVEFVAVIERLHAEGRQHTQGHRADVLRVAAGHVRSRSADNWGAAAHSPSTILCTVSDELYTMAAVLSGPGSSAPA